MGRSSSCSCSQENRDTHPARNQGNGGLSLGSLSLVVAGQSGGHVVGRRLREPWLILVVKISCKKQSHSRELSTSSRTPCWEPAGFQVTPNDPTPQAVPSPAFHPFQPPASPKQKGKSTGAPSVKASNPQNTHWTWLTVLLLKTPPHTVPLLTWILRNSHVSRSKWLLKLLVTGQEDDSESHPYDQVQVIGKCRRKWIFKPF